MLQNNKNIFYPLNISYFNDIFFFVKLMFCSVLNNNKTSKMWCTLVVFVPYSQQKYCDIIIIIIGLLWVYHVLEVCICWSAFQRFFLWNVDWNIFLVVKVQRGHNGSVFPTIATILHVILWLLYWFEARDTPHFGVEIKMSQKVCFLQ